MSTLQDTIQQSLAKNLPASVRDNLFLKFFGAVQVPMIGWVKPKVLELGDERCVVRIPLFRRTKNHLNSMYFGVLCAGADIAGGIMAMRLIQEEGGAVNLVFKDFKAEFLKRAEGDVHFSCTQGAEIREFVRKAMASGERENMPVHVIATVPSKLGDEPVAKFALTLSLKKRSSKK